MNEPETQPLLLFPTENEFATQAQYRTYAFTIGGGALAFVGACVFVFLPALIFPVLLALSLLGAVLLWNYPRLAFYIVFAGICLCEVNPIFHPDSITDRLLFFSNVNTIVQIFTGADFKAMPFNLMELLLFVTGGIAFVRSVFAKNTALRAGPLFLPILVYCGFVLLGWLNGMLTGGDFKVSLMEVRPQLYLLLAYMLAVNVVRDRRDIDKLLWMTAICIGIKGILYTFRRYITMESAPLPDQGVGSHEEAFLFAAYIVLTFLVTLLGFKKPLVIFMWSLLPFVILGDLATNRRAGMGALLMAVPLLLLAVERAVPKYRGGIRLLGIAAAICFALYYPAFKNSNSALAQPAHAISSMFAPDPRDASSNAYRDAENADLMATIRLTPVLGFGYGKPMLHAVPIADISKRYPLWDIMTHNSVFWVWMRVGTVGFFAFWIMIANMILYAGRAVRSETNDLYQRALGIYTILVVTMLLLFGLFDLGITNFREMLFVGIWAGALVAVVKYVPAPSPGNEKLHE